MALPWDRPPKVPLTPVSSVSPRVLRILGFDPDVRKEGLNTYVVGTGKRRILIDTAEPNFPEYVRILEATMIEHDFQLAHIIITHWHKDHLVGVKNVLDMIDNKYECKVWKYQAKDGKNHKYKFPLNALENDQKIRVEGATLKIHHIRGYIPEKIGIILEEDNSLFTVAYECSGGEGADEIEEFGVFIKLVSEICPSFLFLGHRLVIKDEVDELDNFIKQREGIGNILYDILLKLPQHAALEVDLIEMLYGILLVYYNKEGEVDNKIEIDAKTRKEISECSNSTLENPMEDSRNTLISGMNLKKILSYVVRQHLTILEENGKIVHERNIWKLANDSNQEKK